MGGSSKSKDNSARDRQRTQEDLDRNWSKRTSDEDVMGLWQQMNSTQMGQALPLLSALMQTGTSQMNANPYGPKQEVPDMMAMFNSFMPQQPQQPQQPQVQPVAQPGMYNYGVTGAPGIPVPRGKHTFGGVK